MERVERVAGQPPHDMLVARAVAAWRSGPPQTEHLDFASRSRD
jgi:hypothetical protein